MENRYVYHYAAQNNVMIVDGIALMGEKITSADDYIRLKKQIASDFKKQIASGGNYETWIITSLTLLGRECEYEIQEENHENYM